MKPEYSPESVLKTVVAGGVSRTFIDDDLALTGATEVKLSTLVSGVPLYAAAREMCEVLQSISRHYHECGKTSAALERVDAVLAKVGGRGEAKA